MKINEKEANGQSEGRKQDERGNRTDIALQDGTIYFVFT